MEMRNDGGVNASHHPDDSSESAVSAGEDEETEDEASASVQESAAETVDAISLAPPSPRRSPRHPNATATTVPNNHELASPRRSPRRHQSSKQGTSVSAVAAARRPRPKTLLQSKDRTSSKTRATMTKRKATSTLSKKKPASGHTKRLKKTSKQKAFQLATDKRKPDPLLLKRVAFDIHDNGYGEELLNHFGGISKITNSLTKGRYLYGTIARLSKGKGGGVFYEVEWEDSNLLTTRIQLSCLIPALDLCTTLRKERRSSISPATPSSMIPPKRNVAMLLGKKMQSLLTEVEDDAEVSSGTEDSDADGVHESDDNADDVSDDESEENDDFHFDLLRKYAYPPPFLSEDDAGMNNETTDGFWWTTEGTLSPPTNISKRGHSEVRAERRGCFSTPLSSLFSFIPFKVFKTFVIYSNAYADHLMATSGKREISGARWNSDITIVELMTFFGLLFHMVLRPTHGKPYTSCWKDAGWHPYTKHMPLRRFQQIRCVLHFNFSDPSKKNKSKDALYKVRPLLNCLKLTFPLYLQMGDNFALDEASVASRSKYGSDIIFFNPTKPGGKYHFRFYLLCCSTSYVCIRLRMHTKNATDFGDGYFEKNPFEAQPTSPTQDSAITNGNPEEEGKADPAGVDDETTDIAMDETNQNQPVKKMVSLVLDMCKPLFGSGAVVNMDNYYTSPEVAVELKKNDVYIRGTCRTNRSGFPVAVRFTNSEASNQGRGAIKRVVDVRNHLAAYGWVDGNPVHFITSADGTATTEVRRRIGKKVEKVRAPIAIKRYNQNMHAVDRHDQLRETYSLSKRHGFKKYYHKVAMGLFDMAAVNAWLHFKLVHKDLCRNKSARYDFMKNLADDLLKTDWNEYGYTETARQNESIFRSLVEDGDGEETEDNVEGVEESVRQFSYDDTRCQPLSVSCYLGERREKKTGFSCQVCAYEGRGKGSLRSVVICLRHRLRLCTVSRVNKEIDGISDYSWRAPDGTSCWNKAHSFYIPQGLFSDRVAAVTADEVARLNDGKNIKFQCLKTSSELSKKKHAAYGTEGRKPKGRKARGAKNGSRKIRRPDNDIQEDESSSQEELSFKTAEESSRDLQQHIEFTIEGDEDAASGSDGECHPTQEAWL